MEFPQFVSDLKLDAVKSVAVPIIRGGIPAAEHEIQLESLNGWMQSQGLPQGDLDYDFVDPATGEQKAVFDLAWPKGIQEGPSQPVAVLLSQGADTSAAASQAGFRCFKSIAEFKKHVETEVLALERQAG